MTTLSAAPCCHDESVSNREQFLHDVVEGLRRPQKRIPCKYFYDETGSQLFEQICQLDEYYLTRTELGILRRHGAAMAARIGDGCTLIELGSGSAVKTRLLLERLRMPHAYVPIDISRDPLEASARSFADRFPLLRVVPLHADFTRPLVLPELGKGQGQRVVFFPGSTIGNFDPESALDLFASIVRLAGRGGGLLIGFDLDKDEAVVRPAYNDRRGVTAAFNLNLLDRINRELDGDFDLDAFAHRADYVRSRQRVEMHLVSRRAQTVAIAGQTFSFEAAETIHTESSYKYSLEHFRQLTEAAGLNLVEQWTDADHYFAVQYLVAD